MRIYKIEYILIEEQCEQFFFLCQFFWEISKENIIIQLFYRFIQQLQIFYFRIILITYQLIFSCIPDYVETNQFKQILDKYGVTYNDTQISLEKSERKDHQYIVLTFDNERILNDVIKACQSKEVEINNKKFKLVVSKYDKDFKTKLENGGNIVMDNIPIEMQEHELFDLVGQIEQPQSIKLVQYPNQKSQKAYILFDTKEKAQNVVDQVNGKYLNKNQIVCYIWQSLEERIKQNCDILIKNIDYQVTKQQILDVIKDYVNPGVYISLKPSGSKQFAIFTCKDKQASEEFIKKYTENKLVFNNIECTVQQKLSKVMQQYIQQKNEQNSQQNQEVIEN